MKLDKNKIKEILERDYAYYDQKKAKFQFDERLNPNVKNLLKQESKKDFMHKIGISKKEAKETTHWLHMLAVAEPSEVPACRKLWQEAHELTLIFSAIVKRKY